MGFWWPEQFCMDEKKSYDICKREDPISYDWEAVIFWHNSLSFAFLIFSKIFFVESFLLSNTVVRTMKNPVLWQIIGVTIIHCLLYGYVCRAIVRIVISLEIEIKQHLSWILMELPRVSVVTIRCKWVSLKRTNTSSIFIPCVARNGYSHSMKLALLQLSTSMLAVWYASVLPGVILFLWDTLTYTEGVHCNHYGRTYNGFFLCFKVLAPPLAFMKTESFENFWNLLYKSSKPLAQQCCQKM